MAITTSYNNFKKNYNKRFGTLEEYISFKLKYLAETRADTNYYTDKDGNRIIIKPIDHHPNLKEYEVWVEGYAATGESASATLWGKQKARNFAQACHILMCKQFLERAEKYNDPKYTEYINSSRWDYNPNDLSYWGCSFYWSEELARKSSE